MTESATDLLFSWLLLICVAGASIAALVWQRTIWKRRRGDAYSLGVLYAMMVLGFALPALVAARLWIGSISPWLVVSTLISAAAILLPIWLLVVSLLFVLRGSPRTGRGGGRRARRVATVCLAGGAIAVLILALDRIGWNLEGPLGGLSYGLLGAAALVGIGLLIAALRLLAFRSGLSQPPAGPGGLEGGEGQIESPNAGHGDG